SPSPIVAISSVAVTPISRKTASIVFFSGRGSAMAPRTGAMRATIVTAMVVAQANRDVATAGGSPVAAYSLKNGGNTATMTVVQKAEFAQSYIAHARSSGRPNPLRAGGVEGIRTH